MLSKEILESVHFSFRQKIYAKFRNYIFIAIEKKIKENVKIKAKFNKLIMENAKNYKLANSYKKVVKEAKVDWKDLEIRTKYVFLNDDRYKSLNVNLYNWFKTEIEKIDFEAKYNPYNNKLIDDKLILLYVEYIVEWCKKNYNRMSQIKKMKREYKQKWDLENEDYYKNYYINNKEDFKNRYENNKNTIKEKYENNKGEVRDRGEINQEFNAKRHLNSKNLVLEYALKMLANDEKLTIRTLNTTLANNNQKLGITQISLYLKELRSEGLIDE
jgi:hypothetical protein